MRFAIPLLAALTALALVACSGGDEEEAAAPVPLAQRFLTAEDAPGSTTDPVETRQTTVDIDEFIAALSERAVDPDEEEMTTVFQEAGFKGGGADARFFGETHAFTAPHVFSSFIELESEDGATSALDWLETDSTKPCPMSCAVQISNFDVDDIADAPGSTASQGPRTSSGSEPKSKSPSTATGWDSPTVHSSTPWSCVGRRGRCPRSRLWMSQARITTALRAASARGEQVGGYDRRR